MADFSLKAVFGLDAKGLKTELKQIQSDTRDFANDIGKLALAAGVGAFAMLAKGALELGQRLRDTSDNLNIGIKELQALNYAAEQNGSSQEKMGLALQKTKLFMEEAAQGGEKQNEVLKKLGIRYGDIMALPLEQKMETLAKAYANAENEGEAFNAISEIFGAKIGPGMIATLKSLGEDGFDVTAEKAAAAGQIMAESTVRSLEEADQAINDFKQRATIAVGEIIVNFKSEEGIKLLWMRLRATAEGFAAGIGDAIVEAGGMFTSVFGAAGIWLRERVQNALVGAIEVAAKGINAILPKSMEINVAGLEKFRAASEEFGEILAREIAQTEPSTFKKTVEDTWKPLIAAQQKAVDDLKEVPPALRTGIVSGADKLKDAIGGGFEEAEGVIAPFTDAIVAAAAAIETGAFKLIEATRTLAGIRGGAAFNNATDDALEEIIRRNRQQATEADISASGMGGLGRMTALEEAARLRFEAQNAEDILNTRTGVRSAFARGGTAGVYNAFPSKDPLILDKLVDQFAKNYTESERSANGIDKITRGLETRGIIPRL